MGLAMLWTFEDTAGQVSGRKNPSPKRRERCLIKPAAGPGNQSSEKPFIRKIMHFIQIR